MRRKSASRVRRPWFASAAVSAMRTSTSAAWVPRRASAKRAPEKVDPDRGIDEKVAHVGRWRALSEVDLQIDAAGEPPQVFALRFSKELLEAGDDGLALRRETGRPSGFLEEFFGDVEGRSHA